MTIDELIKQVDSADKQSVEPVVVSEPEKVAEMTDVDEMAKFLMDLDSVDQTPIEKIAEAFAIVQYCIDKAEA